MLGAYQKAEDFGDGELDRIALTCMLDECADVIQATSNLIAAALDELEDTKRKGYNFEWYMEFCRRRNVIRGRITKEGR